MVFAGLVRAAGDAEWAAGARQVNDALRQMRQQAHGVPGAMQYVNLAEKLWKQAQEQWAMHLRYQQQSRMDQMRTQLLGQQQNLMNQLIKQQEFLQQQLASSKTPELKTINPFGDYRAHGVSLHPKDGRLHGPGTIADTPELSGLFRQPDMNAKEGPGMEAWKVAMRQLESISSGLSASPIPPAVSSQRSNDKGSSWDNPLAANAVVAFEKPDPTTPVDLSGISDNATVRTLREAELTGEPLEPKKVSESMSNLSDEELESRRQALTTQLKGLKKSSENITAQYEENAVMIQENANQAKSDAKDTIQTVFDDNNPLPVDVALFPEDTSSKPKPSLAEKVVDRAIEVLEAGDPPEEIEDAVAAVVNTLKAGKIAGHAANSIQTDIYVLSTQGKLEPQLDQVEQARKSVFEKLKATIEEQNRRKSALASENPERNAGSASAQPAPMQPWNHNQLELGRRELSIDPRMLVGPVRQQNPPNQAGPRELEIDPGWITNGGSRPSQ